MKYMISLFQFFSFPSRGMAKFFSNLKNENIHFKFQKRKFKNFHFLVVLWTIFSKFKKKNFHFKFFMVV
jgi:hypothetical protein